MTGARARARPRPLALAAALAAAALLLSTVEPSSASWRDDEWVSAPLGTLDCATTDAFTTAASATILEATAVGTGTRPLTDVEGLAASVEGPAAPVVDPITAVPLGDGAFSSPSSAALVSASFDADLAAVLSVPPAAPAARFGQVVRVGGDGRSLAAAGRVTSAGALDPTGPDAPATVVVDLSTLAATVLGPGSADLVAGLTSLELAVGAVAARTSLDGCAAAFGGGAGGSGSELEREYLAADLDLALATASVGQLTGAVTAATASLQTRLAAVPGNATISTQVRDGMSALVLGLVRVGTVTTSLTATVDLSGVQAVLASTLVDPGGLVAIDLAAGTVSIDLAALTGGAQGLDGRSPNSAVAVDGAMVAALEQALLSALAAGVAQIQAAVTAAFDDIRVSGTVVSQLLALGLPIVLGSATTTFTSAPLAALLTGTATAAQVQVTSSGLTGSLLVNVVAALTGGGGAQRVVGEAVRDWLLPAVSGLPAQLVALTDQASDPLVRGPVQAARGVLGATGVATLTVNVQNDPASGGPEPADWAALPAGRFDTAAARLRVAGLIPVTAEALDLVLARSSVGPALR